LALWLVAGFGVLSLGALVWGWFEAGWLRRRVLEVELDGLPAELDGLRITHLSDLHLGVPSRAAAAVDKAAGWIQERRPDLVCLTGDLVSRRAGLPALEQLLSKVGPCQVVLGNHDLASSRDPFSQRLEAADFVMPEGAILLSDASTELELRGCRVQVVGVDPRTYARREAHPERLADAGADLRILLCHFPGIARRLPRGAFHLVLSGHFHAGQIVVPLPGWKLRLAHLRAREVEGIYSYSGTVLHVSPGIGTTFVPFRLFARPEVTELVVRSKA
jgi:predicted MPP superfamily phosphohydrolase